MKLQYFSIKCFGFFYRRRDACDVIKYSREFTSVFSSMKYSTPDPAMVIPAINSMYLVSGSRSVSLVVKANGSAIVLVSVGPNISPTARETLDDKG